MEKIMNNIHSAKDVPMMLHNPCVRSLFDIICCYLLLFVVVYRVKTTHLLYSCLNGSDPHDAV